jgi:hypothetical protein
MKLTNIGTYKRFLSTWDAHLPRVRALILSAIKADIRARQQASQPRADQESEAPLTVGDMTGYEQELMTELSHSTPKLPRRRIIDTSSQGSVRHNEKSSQVQVGEEPSLFTDDEASDKPIPTDTGAPFQIAEEDSQGEE